MSYRDLFRAFVFGSPSEAGHKPDKDQAVIIGDRLDGDLEEVSGYGNRITVLENSQQGGNLGAQTLADLNALAVTLGLGEVDIGKIGEVFDDSTPANNGLYIWTGSAWSYTGLGRLGALESKVLQNDRRINAPISFHRKPILDLANLYGGGTAVYWPVTGSFRTAEDGTIFSVSLTADSKVTQHHKVPVTPTNSIVVIYYDRVDAAVKTAVAGIANMPRNPDRYFFLMALYGGGSGLGTGNAGVVTPYAYESTSAGQNVVARVDTALRYDPAARVLYVPEIYGYNEANTAWTLSPVEGRYRELTDMGGAGIRQVYVDVQDIALNGATSPTALKVISGFANTPAVSRTGGGRMVLLGTQRGSSFTPAEGVNVAQLVPNQALYGKDANDQSEYVYYPDSVPVDLVEPASLALGFTRGWHTPTGTGDIYYGITFPEPVRSGVMCVRFFLEAAADGEFGTPRAYFRWLQTDGMETNIRRDLGLDSASLNLVKEHSPRVREYETYVSVANDRQYVGAYYGTAGAGAGAVKIYGEQVHAGPEMDPFMSRNDYPRPTTIDPIIPDELRFVNGRDRYPIFLDQLSRVARPGRLAVNVSPPGDGNLTGSAVYKTENYGRGGTLIPSGLGQRIWLRDDVLGRAGDVYYKDVAYQSVAVTGKPLNVLMIGDSFFDSTRGCGISVVQRLRDMGFTVTTLGTRTMTSAYEPGSEMGEGRGSREFGDYIHAITTNMAPVTNWSSYLALSNAAKAGFNPFLVADAGPNSRNGYKFSIAPYLAGAGLATPDLILINLHTNDETGKATIADAVLNVVDGMKIMAEEIHADLPGVPIFFVANTSGWRRDEARHEGPHWAVLKAMTATAREIRAAGDTDVYLVPAYAAVSRDIGFVYSPVLGADGVNTASTPDPTHPGRIGVRQYGEIAAQTIASVVGA